MCTSAEVGQEPAEIEGKKQSVRLDVPRNMDRLAMTVVKIDCGDVDPLGGQCTTDAAWGGCNSGGDAIFGLRRGASSMMMYMV